MVPFSGSPMSKAALLVLAFLAVASAGCWSRLGHAEPIDVPVKEIVPEFSFPHQGNGLEFRVLANDVDDQEAIMEAARVINQADEMKEELDELHVKGLPPPGPRLDDARKTPREFIIRFSPRKMSKVSYQWVELGPSQRVSLGLDNAAENDPKRNRTWHEAARSRGRAIQLRDPHVRGNLLHGTLFYSRECKNQNLPQAERQKKAIDYFVLARNPETDIDGLILPRGKPKAITGKHFVSVNRESVGGPAISFSLNHIGGSLLEELTQKNSDGQLVRRHLAVIMNGLVVTVPAINSPIKNRGLISGNFSREELEALVNSFHGSVPEKE
jgi:hypothetical protein